MGNHTLEFYRINGRSMKRVRSDAKALAKKTGKSYKEILDLIAVENFFSNWKELKEFHRRPPSEKPSMISLSCNGNFDSVMRKFHSGIPVPMKELIPDSEQGKVDQQLTKQFAEQKRYFDEVVCDKEDSLSHDSSETNGGCNE